jgi:phospholipid-binding lipoprotein MlaA
MGFLLSPVGITRAGKKTNRMQAIPYRSFSWIPLVFTLLSAAGCAATPGRTTANDPWQGFNRGVYKFNDTVDRAAVKPVAKGYQHLPQWMRSGVGNFFTNLGQPAVIVNQLLQGKPTAAAQDTGRLLLNTVIGIGGLCDVASHAGLPLHDEDMGQTLAKWGVSSGPFLELPVFGPSNVRDAPSRIADYFLGVLQYTDIPPATAWGLRALEGVDKRASLLSVEGTLDQAFDPYAVIRDVWIQRREYQIFDGNPPEAPLEDESGDQPVDDPSTAPAEKGS